MSQYRCTRNQPYIDFVGQSHTKLTERAGYYITAESEQDAIVQMSLKFPEDTAGFTATTWELDCEHCDGSGVVRDSYTWQSIDCTSCAGTGIKDYAKRLPRASLGRI